MRTFSFYHSETGVVHHMTISTNIGSYAKARQWAEQYKPVGHTVMDGHAGAKRVDVVTLKPLVHVEPQHEGKAAFDAQQRINHILAHEQPHAVREALLGYEGSRQKLQDIDDEITRLRKIVNG